MTIKEINIRLVYCNSSWVFLCFIFELSMLVPVLIDYSRLMSNDKSLLTYLGQLTLVPRLRSVRRMDVLRRALLGEGRGHTNLRRIT